MLGSRSANFWKASAVVAIASGAVFTGLSRPLTAPMPDTTEIADMTWVEVRKAIEQGYDTVLVPSGGIEQNGAHMTLGKHQHIVGLAARMIAQERGRTLVAPVIAYVPQGEYEPATGNMRFPGTIGVPEAAFAATLEGAARSLKSAGFKRIVFMADHGGSQRPQAETARRLSAEWGAAGPRVIALGDYYGKGGEAQRDLLIARGETDSTIGDHAGLQDTSELLHAHPGSVKPDRIGMSPGWFAADGSSGSPRKASAEIGEALIKLKVKAALNQLNNPGA